MTPLHRHQLAWLHPAAWAGIVAAQSDPVARDCLAHWAAQALPAVVTRQAAAPTPLATVPPSPVTLPTPHAPAGTAEATSSRHGDDRIAVAVAAPTRWGRRRLAFTVRRDDVLRHGEFPLAAELLPLLPPPARDDWQRLCDALAGTGAVARVYGSHGWQLLTGLDHLREGSDIDLWIAVADEAQADSAAALLAPLRPALPRLDGELCFADGSAVAWREWRDWRSGRVRAVLVKTLHDCRLRWMGAAEEVRA